VAREAYGQRSKKVFSRARQRGRRFLQSEHEQTILVRNIMPGRFHQGSQLGNRLGVRLKLPLTSVPLSKYNLAGSKGLASKLLAYVAKCPIRTYFMRSRDSLAHFLGQPNTSRCIVQLYQPRTGSTILYLQSPQFGQK
jgi:hypothetical protein